MSQPGVLVRRQVQDRWDAPCLNDLIEVEEDEKQEEEDEERRMVVRVEDDDAMRQVESSPEGRG